MVTRLRITAAPAALLAALGCFMQTDLPEPATYIATQHPHAIWIARGDATTRVNQPAMHGDTIVGLVDGETFEIPLRDAEVTVRRIDWPVTDALVGGSGLALLVILSPHRKTAAGGCPCVETYPGLNSCGC